MMKTAIIAMVLLVAPWAATAQSSCPIQPSQVKDTASQLALDFQNTSGKQIASYRFGLTFFDLAGKPHAFPQALAERVQMQSKGHRRAIWQTKLAQRFLFPYAQAFLQQVSFTDGTSWVDDGSHSCSVISLQE
jgi:hypothetical protein